MASMKGLPESITPKEGGPFITQQNAKAGDARMSYLPASEAESLAAYNWKSCAVVGNSGVLQKTRFGAAIDAHSVVLRANQAPTGGQYAATAGRRTTFRLLNKLWTEKYGGKDGQGERPRSRAPDKLLAHGSGRRIDPAVLPLERNVTLLATRVDAALVLKLHLKHQQGKRKDLRVLSMSDSLHGYAKKLVERFRERMAACSKKKVTGPLTPSSGLVGVYMMMHLCERVSVYGFGHDGKSPYQYYRFYNTERAHGASEVHSFDHEYRALQTLSKDKYITLCTWQSRNTCGK